ncbi:hypothetical protein MLD38_013358 [Melastoma candidum]|uniref:Uncharacterized protein n=1 Tax=Melastoma candidum TaxID=119954 RepID=A0ACB9R8Q3_9MYRT|nr:hypothetical protein MLD38_013358 [Melastoma candidum]
MCMMPLYMGRHPFHLQDPGDLTRLSHAICQGEPPQLPLRASSELRDFVASCLQKDNTKRWTAAELLNHPFILGHKECTT